VSLLVIYCKFYVCIRICIVTALRARKCVSVTCILHVYAVAKVFAYLQRIGFLDYCLHAYAYTRRACLCVHVASRFAVGLTRV
jgi:hypothetical protein